MPQIQSYGLQGGLDLVTPPIQLPPGKVIAALNYEPHPRGYQRVDGFEALDGRPRPSQQSYWTLSFDAGTAAIAEDDIVTGATSGATGRALINAVVESGSYGGSDAAGYIVIMGLTGDFNDNENLQVSAVTKSVANGLVSQRGAATDALDTSWFRAAIEKARDDIEAVPGSGLIRGVWFYSGAAYAFRDNAGATACIMHKATAAGWAAQGLGSYIAFDAGTAVFEDGETITGGTSSATATLARLILEDGSFGANDALGKFILTDITGVFVDNETITGGTSSGSATSNGAVVANTLPPGGSYQFDNYNFFAGAGTNRMYGANSVGTAFEWDGSLFVPIETGMVDDRPLYVAAHRNYLFLAFPNGSVQFSSLGTPYAWDVVTGAGEIGIGEEVTGLLPSVSGALVIFGRNRVAVLFGTGSSNFELRTLADDSGAIAGTAQTIGTPVYHDNVGLRSLDSTDQFGDFNIGTITQMIEPLFQVKKRANVAPIGSLRVRDKDQYRLYWADGSGIAVYFGRQSPEILPFNTGLSLTCFASGKDSNGDERLLVGSEDGFVYELDAGTSFNGESVNAFLRMPFNNVGSPAQKKRWNKVTVEVDSGPRTRLGLTVEYGYADPDQPPSTEQLFTVRGSGGFWDEFLWDQFFWSSPVEGQAEAHIDGLGRNLSVTVISDEIYEEPHILHGVVLQFNYRGVRR